MKRIAILGSTGSIGRSALAVVDAHPERLRVVGLAAGENTDLLATQIAKYRPRIAALSTGKADAYLGNWWPSQQPVFGSMLDKGSVAVSGTLLTGTLKAATLLNAGQAAAAVVSAKVVALMEGVLKAMLLTKLKIGAALVDAHPHLAMPTQRLLHLAKCLFVAVRDADAPKHVHLADLAIDRIA